MLRVRADDDFAVWINGFLVMLNADYGTSGDKGPDYVFERGVSQYLRQGELNVMTFVATDGSLNSPSNVSYEHLAFELKLNNQVANPYVGFIPQFTGMGSATIPFGRLFQRNPLWTEIWTLGEPLGTSNYHAGYVQAEHRFSRGYGFLVNYTFSKLLNDVGSYDGSFSMPYPQAGLPVSNTSLSPGTAVSISSECSQLIPPKLKQFS